MEDTNAEGNGNLIAHFFKMNCGCQNTTFSKLWGALFTKPRQWGKSQKNTLQDLFDLSIKVYSYDFCCLNRFSRAKWQVTACTLMLNIDYCIKFPISFFLYSRSNLQCLNIWIYLLILLCSFAPSLDLEQKTI